MPHLAPCHHALVRTGGGRRRDNSIQRELPAPSKSGGGRRIHPGVDGAPYLLERGTFPVHHGGTECFGEADLALCPVIILKTGEERPVPMMLRAVAVAVNSIDHLGDLRHLGVYACDLRIGCVPRGWLDPVSPGAGTGPGMDPGVHAGGEREIRRGADGRHCGRPHEPAPDERGQRRMARLAFGGCSCFLVSHVPRRRVKGFMLFAAAPRRRLSASSRSAWVSRATLLPQRSRPGARTCVPGAPRSRHRASGAPAA